MSTAKFTYRFLCLLGISLFFSAAVTAQNGRHHDSRHYSNNSGRYNTRHYYPVRYSNPYNYYPNYYSRPLYRPHSYYHSIYRLPNFIHYGPAFGLRIGILPFGYYPFYIGPSPYYYNDGIYYRPYSNGGGYEVTPPPIGATIPHLPSGAKLTVIDGDKYYELGGTFYHEDISSNNKIEYRVVGTDGVLNTGTEEQPGSTSYNNNNDNNIENNNAANNNNNNNNNVNNNNTAPIPGSRVDQLPANSKVIVINKQKYYLSPDGVYYNEVIDGNTVKYEVAGIQ